MERIPTQLIMYKQAGLLGAAYGAMRDFQEIDDGVTSNISATSGYQLL